ncbi:MAG: aminotransferase class IV [Lutisporaceae bacterium]
MNNEIIENYFISNGSKYPSNQIIDFCISQPTIYEVIRVIEGVPLFLEDHLVRLQASATSLNIDIQGILSSITSDISELIKINNNPEKNIKLVVYNLENKTPDYIISFIHSNYPTKEQYLVGVPTILFHAERHNPNAKIINNELRETINIKLKEENAYEVLLVNSRGEITEGSRSNLFFIEEGKVYTASAENVLIGITRKYILKACNNLKLEVIEQPIPFSMLEYAEGAFITGTSPKVLPIASIDGMLITSANNSIVSDILNEYDIILKQYITIHK